MTLDGERVTAAELSRMWGIKPSRILTSYNRHKPDSRHALREAIQHDLTHRKHREPPHAGSLVWGAKGRNRSDFPKSLNCEGLRQRLIALGALPAE